MRHRRSCVVDGTLSLSALRFLAVVERRVDGTRARCACLYIRSIKYVAEKLGRRPSTNRPRDPRACGTGNNLARITGGRRSRQLGPACQRYRAHAQRPTQVAHLSAPCNEIRSRASEMGRAAAKVKMDRQQRNRPMGRSSLIFCFPFISYFPIFYFKFKSNFKFEFQTFTLRCTTKIHMMQVYSFFISKQ
jgi:hypothetical protein